MNDVVEALRFAQQNSLKTALLGAGHQVVGIQLLPNGLTIDTKNLTAIDVDGDSQTVYVQAGATVFSHAAAWYVSVLGCERSIHYQCVQAVQPSIVKSEF